MQYNNKTNQDFIKHQELAESHSKFIQETFGDDYPVNFGWVTDSDAITSKLHNHPSLMTVTTIRNPDGSFEHSVD